MEQGQDILELIAEPVSTTRLGERRSAPHPARKRLVDQPAVHHEVERRVWRFHLDRVTQRIPLIDHGFQRLLRRSGCEMSLDYRAGDLRTDRLPQQKHDRAFLARLD